MIIMFFFFFFFNFYGHGLTAKVLENAQIASDNGVD